MKGISIVLFFVLAVTIPLSAQESSPQPGGFIKKTTVSGEWYLGYSYNQARQENAFNLKRGYITIKSNISDMFSVRYTQDVTLIKSGDLAGDLNTRMKYMMLVTKFRNIPGLSGAHMEIGLVHRPWTDFEQKFTGYRSQGEMFLDRNDMTVSADLGVTFAGLLGGEVSEDFRKNVSSAYPGKWGSFSIGIYNGGGYHGLEENSNKVVEGRLTLRPLPEKFPGLQVSYMFATGQANTDLTPAKYRVNMIHVMSQSRLYKLGLQYFAGLGSTGDHYFDQAGNSNKSDGFSGFGEFFIPGTNLSVFGRYDHFNLHEAADMTVTEAIGGISYRINDNKILFDINRKDDGNATVNVYEVVLDLKF